MGSLSSRRHAFFSSDLCGAAILGLCVAGTVWGWAHGRLTRHSKLLVSEVSCPSSAVEDGGRWHDSGLQEASTAEPIVNSIGIRLLLIPAGEFAMGSPGYEDGRDGDELQHRVRISKPFYLSVYEITVAQFRRFVEETGHRTEGEKCPEENTVLDVQPLPMPGEVRTWRNPGFSQADDHPVVYVSWPDAVAFCRWLSAKEGREYRLPTEAEWEYACRAGTTTRFAYGRAETELFSAANVRHMTRADNGAIQHLPGPYLFTAPVGLFKPNAFGLHDMHGNVWEWCSDWYAPDYYSRSATLDPTGDSTGEYRIVRGGSFRFSPWHARAANRYTHVASRCTPDVGFRVALNDR